MAKKPDLTTITTGYYSTTALNSNFEAIRTAFENTISRDGSVPNSMSADFDLNGYNILNAGTILSSSGTDFLTELEAARDAAQAAQSASEAASSAASTSASDASSSASSASSSASAAASSYDAFDDRYLGAKSSNPALDNDGDALLTGALYFNTTSNEMRVYTGSAWQTVLEPFLLDEDDFVSNSATKAPSQQSVKAYVDNAVSSSLTYRGGYDASTNTPDLDTSPAGVLVGDTYAVTVAGTFFTAPVGVGDLLIAEANSAATESDWTIVASSIGQSVGTGDSPTFAGLTVNGNITVTGTVDGRDVASDGSKLDAIESGATADQTGAEIKTLYEAEADTNAFTDAEKSKLAGVEAGAKADQVFTQGSGISLTSLGGDYTISHADTSSQANVTNTGRTFIQSLNVDTYGHVTSITSATDADTYVGTVTSVGVNVPAGFTSSGGPITDSGTISIGYDTGYQGYTSTEATKLSGIETGADVTDAANVEPLVDAHLNTSSASSGEFLAWNGTDYEWVSSLSGTVTSVAASVPTGFSVSGSPITTSGTLAVTYAAGYQGYTTAEANKLSAIEDGADVTDTGNVTAAGALMDSEVTNLAAVKAFDPTDYATAAQGALADSALQSSDIGVTVQGYSAVLAGTTASFTTADETKLDGIEAGADVTDTTNVTAAGALMDSELTSEASVKALDQGVATTDSPSFAGLTVDTSTLYVDSANNRVGIGTITPGAPFEVQTSAGERIRLDSDGGSQTPKLSFIRDSGADYTLLNDQGVWKFNRDTTQIYKFSSDAHTWSTAATSDAMTIVSGGNVGIGTTGVDAKLHVSSGNVSFSPSADADELFLENNGNVGMTFGAGTNGTANIYFGEKGVGASRGAIVFDTSDESLRFSTAGLVNERLIINSSGNVGIGTTSPSEKLHVSGNAYISADLTSRHYHTRGAFVADSARALGLTNGEVVIAGGLHYEYSPGATDISDLPDFVPYGEIAIQHFTSATTAMQGAVVAAAAYATSKYTDSQMADVIRIHACGEVVGLTGTVFLNGYKGISFENITFRAETSNDWWPTSALDSGKPREMIAVYGQAERVQFHNCFFDADRKASGLVTFANTRHRCGVINCSGRAMVALNPSTGAVEYVSDGAQGKCFGFKAIHTNSDLQIVGNRIHQYDYAEDDNGTTNGTITSSDMADYNKRTAILIDSRSSDVMIQDNTPHYGFVCMYVSGSHVKVEGNHPFQGFVTDDNGGAISSSDLNLLAVFDMASGEIVNNYFDTGHVDIYADFNGTLLVENNWHYTNQGNGLTQQCSYRFIARDGFSNMTVEGLTFNGNGVRYDVGLTPSDSTDVKFMADDGTTLSTYLNGSAPSGTGTFATQKYYSAMGNIRSTSVTNYDFANATKNPMIGISNSVNGTLLVNRSQSSSSETGSGHSLYSGGLYENMKAGTSTQQHIALYNNADSTPNLVGSIRTSGTGASEVLYVSNAAGDGLSVDASGNVGVSSTLELTTFTVATLPTGVAGARSFVTDANATTFGSVVAGGGANGVPVYHDGTNWRIG